MTHAEQMPPARPPQPHPSQPTPAGGPIPTAAWPAPPAWHEPAVDVAAAATAARGRSLAPDLARGLMLLLIALANVPWLLHGREQGLSSAHQLGHDGADLGYQLLSLVVIDGRAYPLFAFLFGYGIWQLYSRQSAAGTPWREARRILQRRHAWMVAIGAVHALLLWFGDIVGAYGLTGLVVVALLLRRSDRVLRIVAWVLAGLLALFAAMSLAGGLLLGTGIAGDLSSLAGGGLATPAGEPSYPWFALQSLGLWLLATPGQLLALTVPLAVVLGMLAARRGLLDRPRDHRRTLVGIAVVGIAIGWAGGALAAAQFAGLVLDPALSWGTMGVSSLAGVAGGIGYAALFALAAAAIGERRGIVVRALAAVGKRSLSSYLLQSVLLVPTLAAWGFGLGSTLTPLAAAGVAVAAWLVSVAVALVLDARGTRGPAEALLRRLAYGSRPVAPPTPVA
ncbi:hypothetical protein L332_04665 [Agrococcus pavilionensis RW1]|uniref:DUF418 domain-containing protein n=1 Tax=Agrococcus pavilionensis RW1 TaxID=1330458 RepID=U1MPC5_9MICO|nr:DUF418 domain-containing protein [Agrococcus pavilionensis]ERG63746.1 hypothetical protein L332_04665 [Agrococcus pavilionensis RW1]